MIARLAALVLSAALITGCTPSAPTSPDGSPVASPTDASEPSTTDRYVVERSTFEVRYRLDAAVTASDVMRIDVPTGLVFKATAKVGDVVRKGQVLGRLELPEDAPAADSGTVARSRWAAAKAKVRDVKAQAPGTFTGGAEPGVRSQGLDVVTDLSPLQVLRYEGMNFTGTADVETVLGQRRVACLAVWLATPSGSRNSQVHCRLPDNVETASGIPGILTLIEPAMKNVYAVPLPYVGLDASGTNYVVDIVTESGATKRPVTVGVTDGVRRVVTSGLQTGDTLQTVEP